MCLLPWSKPHAGQFDIEKKISGGYLKYAEEQSTPVLGGRMGTGSFEESMGFFI